VLCLVVALTAYLLGSIPTGFLFAKARGLDIRTVGSGNIGATNVFRSLGKPAGIAVLALDGLKGYLACTVLVRSVAQAFGAAPGVADREGLAIIAGIAAILGHNYTCWLGFKGGKGIATSAGVLISLLPWPFLIILGVWIVVFCLSRYVSLASVSAAVVLPFATGLTGKSPLMIGVAASMSALAIYKHRSNIQRLVRGSENRVSFKKARSSTASNG